MKTNGHWGVYLFWKSAFNPVSFCVYISLTYAHAFEWFNERGYPRKQRFYVKRLDNKHRFKEYDEKFDAMLQLMQNDLEPDEYYQEPTPDDKAIVQIHQPDRTHPVVRAIWKSPQRRL